MNLIYSEYEIIDFPNESLIVSSIGASKTCSLEILNILHKLKALKSSCIDDALLNSIILKYKLPPKDVFLFLQNAIGLKPQPSEIFFKKTLIVHDWKDKKEFENIIDQELTCDYEIVEDLESLYALASGKSCFIILVCMKYDYAKIKEAYFHLAELAPFSAISVAYVSGNTFRIDQPYVAEIGNPCHFCIIDRQLHYEKCGSSQNSWSALLNFCMDRNLSLPLQNLSFMQRCLAVGAITKKIKFHTEHTDEFHFQDNILTSTVVKFNKGIVGEESIAHWHCCTCLRSKNEKYTT